MVSIKKMAFVAVLLSSSSVMASNIWILSKVKPEDGASIYVEISYYPVWSPLIPIKKTAELRYNEEVSLVGLNRINWIRIRNVKDETETETVASGGQQSTARRTVQSRIESIAGDTRILKACDVYLDSNPMLKGVNRNKARREHCNPEHLRTAQERPGYLHSIEARLVNKEIVVNQVTTGLLTPVAIAVTRSPGTRDFIVTELSTGVSGREQFYFYVKGKDLDK